MSKKLSDFKVANYITPYGNNILVKWETSEKTESGVIIPDHLREKKLGLEVLAIGCDVTKIKIGDLVVPTPAMNVATFEIMGTVVAQIADYNVFSIISKDYERDNKEYMKLKSELNESTIN